MEHMQSDRLPGTMSARIAGCAGVVFFVLIVIQANLRSGAPSATDSETEVFQYVTDHQARLQLGATLLGLAMAAAVFWLSALFRAVRKAEGGTPALATAVLAGGVLAAAGTVTGALIQGTVAVRVNDLAEGVGVWWTMVLLSTGATLLGLLVVIATTAGVGLRTGLFPRWFAFTGIVLALISTVGACTIGYDASGIQAIAGSAVLLDSVWILLVSLFLFRNPDLAVP
jgi:hypothetical protein